jgi:DNA primase
MISEIDKQYVLGQMNVVLGEGRNLGSSEIQYYCPFCSHHKPKLQVNLESQKWRCWVCNARGKKVHSLLKKLSVDYDVIQRVMKIYDESGYVARVEDEEFVEIKLPSEYKTLLDNQHIIEFRVAYNYLKKRGITDRDILKHKIGYCDGGMYKGRIIIPSYNSLHQLNFFLARSIYPDEKLKYKNPPVSKNIIGFESMINWKMPVTLCEGAFDAIAIKRNASPVLGKTLSKELTDKILTEKPSINIVLDDDAMGDAIRHYEYLTANGIDCKLIRLSGKDPSEMGFIEVTKQIEQNTTSSFEDLIRLKLSFT